MPFQTFPVFLPVMVLELVFQFVCYIKGDSGCFDWPISCLLCFQSPLFGIRSVCLVPQWRSGNKNRTVGTIHNLWIWNNKNNRTRMSWTELLGGNEAFEAFDIATEYDFQPAVQFRCPLQRMWSCSLGLFWKQGLASVKPQSGSDILTAAFLSAAAAGNRQQHQTDHRDLNWIPVLPHRLTELELRVVNFSQRDDKSSGKPHIKAWWCGRWIDLTLLFLFCLYVLCVFALSCHFPDIEEDVRLEKAHSFFPSSVFITYSIHLLTCDQFCAWASHNKHWPIKRDADHCLRLGRCSLPDVSKQH